MSKFAPLLVLVGLSLLAASATAELKSYTLRGDSGLMTPTDGTTMRPHSVSGQVVIEDNGDDSPTLEAFR